MPVTELSWVTSKRADSTHELAEACHKGMNMQSEWVALYASSTLPTGPPALRGSAVYQQREDTAVLMLTAHWDSVAQHEECIASDLNREAIGAIGLHMDPSQLKVTHVQDVRMFPAEMLREEEEEASLLSVVRLLVRNNGDGDGDGVVSESESINNNKARVERIWTSRAKHMLADAAGGLGRYHVAGWRVERDDDQGGEEFVIVGPWASAGPLDDFVNGTWKYAHAWAEVWGDVVSEPDIKTYIRI